jgi:hypothetical protein
VIRARGIALAVTLLGAACTAGGEPPSAATAPPSDATAKPNACPAFVLERNDGACVDSFDHDGATYQVRCVVVPDVLIDVPVAARWGRGAVRAIAAIPVVHAVAVTGIGDECGAYPLALRDGLSHETAEAIVAELERAATLPPDLEKDPPEPAD